MSVSKNSREADLGRPSLIAGYRPPPGGYDEMLAADGQARPHWQIPLATLEGIGERELPMRWQSAERQIAENAVIYNAFADPGGQERPWQLDPVPLVLPAAEWRVIEAGLLQRARILNAVLADLYGAQHLLREGLLPAGLVLGNPQFLRPCHGAKVPGGVWLHHYACDIGRGADGRWRVLSDRTQTPTGAGFALENRIILSRSLPELFREQPVHRLASYFQRRHDGLLKLAPRDNPRVVLLSPGPANESYFEHAYLARYLGYTLVEGADLTTRDNQVFLKTVDGLKRVDLIVRRVDGNDCDPLELRNDSPHGIPGLLQAARDGSVTVANALGSGLVECEGFLSHLPRLARYLLRETLSLESDAAWWCGDPAQRAYVASNLDRLALYPAFARRPMLARAVQPLYPAGLPAAERAALLERLESRGYEYVARETFRLSTVPVWNQGRLVPAPMVLRCFVAATEDGGWSVMPGGLARISTDGVEQAPGLPRRGDGSKDVWVLSDGPVSTFSLLRAPHNQVTLLRSGRDLSSRAADSLFWLGRYADRAEGGARLLRSLLTRLAEDAGEAIGTEERQLVAALAAEGVLPETAIEAGHGQLDRELRASLYDPALPGGHQGMLHGLLRNAALVRDRLSVDAWRTLNRLRRDGAPLEQVPRLDLGRGIERLNDILLILSAFNGMEMENMTRNHGWRFLDIGRRLERALHMVDLLRVFVASGDAEKEGTLALLLELADSFMTYRSRYMTTPQLAPVLDLLLADETNPRSICFQLAALETHAGQLPVDGDLPLARPERRLVLSMLTEVRLADVQALCTVDAAGSRPSLIGMLDRLAEDLPRLSEVIARGFFSHAERSRPAEPGRGAAP